METLSEIIAEILIDGRNVTADVSGMLSTLTYTDRLEGGSDEISISFEDTEGLWSSSWYPAKGDSLQVKIGNNGRVLDCGIFEIDQIEYSYPLRGITIKGISAPITKSLRTAYSKNFEKQSLRSIAQFIATKHGLRLTGNISDIQKIEIGQKTQDNETDLAFLFRVSKEYGIIFSVRGDQLIFITIEELEQQPSVCALVPEECSKMDLTDKTSQTYTGVIISSRDSKTGSLRKYERKPSGNDKEADVLIIHNRTENSGQAQALAISALKTKNREKTTGTISKPGNTELVAGTNIDLLKVDSFSGKWHIVSSTHTITKDNGYTTNILIRKIA